METLLSYIAIFPEAILALGALCLLLISVFFTSTSGRLGRVIALSILAIALFSLFQLGGEETTLFLNSYVFDKFAKYIKILIIIAAMITVLLSTYFMEDYKGFRGEYLTLLLFSVLGMMVMISSRDLITAFVGLELQSLSLYVLAAFGRESKRSSEAGLKYFILGALSSCLFLYGASMLYGFSGATSFSVIAQGVGGSERPAIFVIGLVFVLAALGFKIAAAPFHMWSPDVYEGAPTTITSFFAVAPKFAAVALLCRFCFEAFGGVMFDWQQVIYALAIMSMLVGAFGALPQTNIKRLMAYSSIGHVGFVLVALASGSVLGVQAILLYLTIYLFSVLGTFAVILSMRHDESAVETIGDLAGLSRHNLLQASCLAIMMFSMIGLPPLAGFFAKYFVFLAAIKAKMYVLAVLGVLASVVGAYYYLNIVKTMFFDEPKEPFDSMNGSHKLVLTLCTAFVLGFILLLSYFDPISFDAAEALVGAQ